MSATKQKVKDRWWLYEASSKALFHAVGNSDLFENKPQGMKGSLEKAIAIARVSKTGAFTLVPTNCVFAAEVVVIASDDFAIFSVLQSSIHLAFAWNYAGKMKVDLRYSPTMCFEPFPFPEELTDDLKNFGKNYYDKRASILNRRKVGLTKLYNDFHKEDNIEADICELRESHAHLDSAVIEAYGWSEILLDHGFHEVAYLPENDRVRFTISEAARVEVLRRLSELNRQRYKDEVDKGLHGNVTSRTSSGSKKGRTRSSKAESFGLFDFAASETVTGNEACKFILNRLSETDAWLAKDDILTGSGLPANQWQSTINQLLADGLVERKGERRGAKYRAVKRNRRGG